MEKAEIFKKAEEYLEYEEHELFRNEVIRLMESGNTEDLSDRFWRDLDFGTGGLRGVIGGGYNRMNPYIVRKATKGLANYILSHVPEGERSVAIGYDSRHYSDLFAEEAARVLAANGIKVWLFSSLRPTPMVSYAVRKTGSCAGIMVTASHNPAEYNGYKVYWSDGAQIVPPHDKGIISEVRNVSGKVDAMDRDAAEEKGLIVTADSVIDKEYFSMVENLSLNPELIREHGKNLKVVYTPLHGAGLIPVETVLSSLGISVITVPEQREPDGDFPTVKFPNPEMAPALELSIKLAKEKNADLVMATDPDSDRLGIAVPDNNDWVLITGNQLGALLADYILRVNKEKGTMPANPAFINTIVTTEMQNKIADYYGAESFRVLTGFKYIGEKIRQFESDNTYSYVFGCEESYGYLVGTDVRDKDAVSAAMITAEMTLWNSSRGFSVMDHLREIWAKFGYWKEILISRYFEGEKGAGVMNNLMETLRSSPPENIGSGRVVSVRDFLSGTTKYTETGETKKDIDLPSSNVIQFSMADGSLITARPSGTEPKIKFYASCRYSDGSSPETAEEALKEVISGIENWINQMIETAGG